MPFANKSGLAWLPAAMVSSPAPHRFFSVSLISTLSLFFHVFLLLISDHCATANLQNDAQALLAFKNNLDNNATKLSSWKNVTDICVSWVGVTCGAVNQTTGSSSDQRVLALRLPGRSLYGSISEGTLGKIDSLQVLSLHHNHLKSFPSDLSNCASLRELYLHNNDFSGPLPSDFSAWPILRRIDLSFNSFNGSIPPSLNNLTQLRYLRLQGNNLSGSIPSLSGIAANLQNFSVAQNNLSGSIPSYLSRFGQESFAGNRYLCGSPLQTPCVNSSPSPSPSPSPPPPSASPPQIAPSPSPSDQKKLGAGAIAAITVVSAAGVALLFLLCLIQWSRRFKSKKIRVEESSNPYAGRETFQAKYTYHDNADSIKTINSKPPSTMQIAAIGTDSGRRALKKLTFLGDDDWKQNYDLEDLLRASAEVLGKGSFGTVYKATMNDGLTLVVKRLREVGTNPGGDASCKSAVEMVGSLRHANLVPLQAFFFTEREKLLISDYMSGESLFSLLHGNTTKGPLEWKARLIIASEAANALVFLHSKKVVHGNIKSSNVLLDRQGVARWSDYGLLQKVGIGAESVKPNGYTPPEAASDVRKINYKGDVYSFGVLLLELVTGKCPMKLYLEDKYLPKWVESCVREEAVDPFLKEKYADENDVILEFLDLLHIALLCVFPYPDKRPHMVEIVKHIQDLIDHQKIM